MKCAIHEKSDEPNHGVAHESISPMKNPQPPTKPSNARKLLQMVDNIEKDMVMEGRGDVKSNTKSSSDKKVDSSFCG